MAPCEEGDFVFLLSSGVWRNLQPFYLRNDISEADREQDYPFLAHSEARTWGEVQNDPRLPPWMDTAITLPLLRRTIARASQTQGGLSAESIVQAFVTYAVQVTQPVLLLDSDLGLSHMWANEDAEVRLWWLWWWFSCLLCLWVCPHEVRQWMLDNPGRRLLGADVCAGWMGEASCVCLAVGSRTTTTSP